MISTTDAIKAPNDLEADLVVLVKGKPCPMPTLIAKRKILTIKKGAVLEIVTTESQARIALPTWINKNGHQYLGEKANDDSISHFIKRGA